MPFPQNRNNEGQGGLIPPPNQPVRRFTTPSRGDGFYVERIDVSARDYVPLLRGTRYSTVKNAEKSVIAQFGELHFLKETLDPFFWPWALRYWATDELAESTYNAQVTFINENVDYPMYARIYTLRREEYEYLPPIDPGTPLTGVIAVLIENPGLGYTADDEVHFSSGDAEAQLVVDSDGKIVNVVIEDEATGYDSDDPPDINIVSDTGNGAELTAVIQPKTAVLTSQKKTELPDSDEHSYEWVSVLRIYETLPGPFDYTTRLDPDNVVVAIGVRRNIAANIQSGETSNSGISIKTTKKGDQNSYVADEIVETRALPGPPIPSILVGDDLLGAYVAKELYYSTDITPFVGESGGVLTTVEKKDVSDSLSEKVTTVRKWLDDADYKIEIPNVIPLEFRALIPTITVSHKVVGLASQPSIGPNEFARAEKQLDAVFKRVTVETLGDISLPITHTTTRETNDFGGGLMDVVRTLASGLQTAQEGFNVFDSHVEDLGNGLSFRETISFQLDFPSLYSARADQDLEFAAIHKQIKTPGSITPEISEADGILTTVEEEGMTHLRALQVTTEKRWLDDADFSITIPDVIPQWARALVPTITVSHKVKGTASQPVLGLFEFARTEKQIDALFKRVTVETLDFSAVELTLTNKGLTEKFGGDTTTITLKLNVEGTYTVDEGLLILDSKIERLGNGLEVKSTEAADSNWTEMYGQEYDEGLDVTIPFAEQTITEGTHQGDAHTNISTEDQWRSKKRTIDISAAEAVLGAYLMQYPSKTNISMPDKLVSLDASIQSQIGDALDNETGSVAGYGSYSINLDLRADATASATIIPEVIATIKQFYGSNIDCTHYIFFLPNPVTSVDVLTKIAALIGGSVSPWPKFNPQTLTMLIVGANAALKVNAVSKGSYSQAADLSSQSSTSGGGTGYSRAKGMTLRRMEISPTIHGSLSIGGVTSDTVDLNAYCEAEATGLGPNEAISQTDSVAAFTTPTTFSPTDGDTDWPTSGKLLYRVDGRPYKYGFVMFHVIIVDAADFPNA